ncbi:MAG: patatin-like phospholipase family protein [Thermoanaerobaculia bacterium]
MSRVGQPDPPREGERHVLALDGGGVRGIVTLRMLEAFEERFGMPACEFFDFFAGTSTGAIIAALLAFRRLAAREILDLYRELVGRVFEWSLSSSRIGRLFSRMMYSREFAEGKLAEAFGDTTLGELPAGPRGPRAILLTTHDLVRNEELFLSNFPLKGGNPNFGPTWKVRDAVAASALSAPWYFGPWEGRFTDGGLTVFNTPARQAAIEALDYCARPECRQGQTVVWSFGSGAFETEFRRGEADRWFPWSWAARLFRDVQSDAESDQVFGAERMARRGEIEFRRYQVTIGKSTLTDLGYGGEVPSLPIELDRSDARDFLDEVGRLFAARVDWSDPHGFRLSAPVPDPFQDPQLWRSREKPPQRTPKPPSARLA